MIQTPDSSRFHVGNNSITVPYPVPFLFHEDEHLVVVVVDSAGIEDLQVLGTDYTVTGANNPDGGSIKTTWPVPVTSHVSIARIVPMTQLTSYEEGDSFPAKSHEKALDKGIMIDQQQARGMGDGTGGPTDIGTAFRVTEASGGLNSVPRKSSTSLGVDDNGSAVLRTPSEMLIHLGQVGNAWADAAARTSIRGAYPGQLGVQLDNWTIYVARSTTPGHWVPFLSSDGVVISTTGTPTAKANPDGDIVGTSESQILTNKTLNAPTINNPAGMDSSDVGLGNVDNTQDLAKPVSVPQLLALDAKQNLAEKGLSNGYPSLDGSGKVPLSQLPEGIGGGSGSVFKGTWNAATNTPTIPPADLANTGAFYIVAVAGTTTIDGVSSWAIGDHLISNGAVWQKVASTADVISVNGKTGVVVVTKADVGLSAVDNTSDPTKNAATATLVNKTIRGSQNTLEVRLDLDVVNNLSTSRLNNGTGAAPDTWWCGDGSWKKPSGTGDVGGPPFSINGEVPVFNGTSGKEIRTYAGPSGVAKIGADRVFSASPLASGDIGPEAIHGQTLSPYLLDDDEFLVWDSATGTLKKATRNIVGVPVGVIMDFAGAETGVPTGWLICAGQLVLKATYPVLFALLGTTWGAGNATQFNIPDLRGYVTAGKDDMGGTSANRLTSPVNGDTLAAAGGNELVALSTANLAAHTHGGVDHLHSLQGHSHQLGGYYVATSYQNSALTGSGSINVLIGPVGSPSTGGPSSGTTGAADRALTTGAAGSGTAHTNLQPTRILNKIIKY